ERDTKPLGRIVGWYGGSESATPGHEHREVERLIADAERGIFDAVVVAYADRWSKSNTLSKRGLGVFRRHGIAFYVGSTPMDLTDPSVNLLLGVQAEIGEFLAAQQARKSMETRLERAGRGLPACGKLPWGRTFKGGEWGIDAGKQAALAEIAARYLGGES